MRKNCLALLMVLMLVFSTLTAQAAAPAQVPHGILQHEVQDVGAIGVAEHLAQLAESRRGQARAVAQGLLDVGQVGGHVPGVFLVLRVAGEVVLVALGRLRIGAQVDLVRVGVESGQAAGDEGLRQAVGSVGQVVGDAESAEGLAEGRPRSIARVRRCAPAR